MAEGGQQHDERRQRREPVATGPIMIAHLSHRHKVAPNINDIIIVVVVVVIKQQHQPHRPVHIPHTCAYAITSSPAAVANQIVRRYQIRGLSASLYVVYRRSIVCGVCGYLRNVHSPGDKQITYEWPSICIAAAAAASSAAPTRLARLVRVRCATSSQARIHRHNRHHTCSHTTHAPMSCIHLYRMYSRRRCRCCALLLRCCTRLGCLRAHALKIPLANH